MDSRLGRHCQESEGSFQPDTAKAPCTRSTHEERWIDPTQYNRSTIVTNASASHLQGASEQLGLARDHVIVGVADAVNSGVDAAREVKAQVGESVDSLLDQGKDLVNDAADGIRTRPLATVGLALAGGYLFGRLVGRN
jgi:hypothetical protein